MELSEAGGLADIFVFRLMFRPYRLPRSFADYRGGSSDRFYQSKRLLNAFAAHARRFKDRTGTRTIEYDQFLVLSALTVDAGIGACAALEGGQCGIYRRRPLTCRTVPFIYSRPEAAADEDLSAFVQTQGYRCDTSGSAPVVLRHGRIVDAAVSDARATALQMADENRPWSSAIVRRMKAGYGPLPSLSEVEANAATGLATTVSFYPAWQIAADAGLMTAEACAALIDAQMGTIERALRSTVTSPETRETLTDMKAEYRELLALF